MGSLLYPIDAEYIMQKKRSLLRQLKEEGENRGKLMPKRVAILSGATVGEIEAILRIFLIEKGIEPTFFVGEYGRFYEDLVFDDGTLKEFAPDIIYIHISVKNLEFPPFSLEEKKADEFAKQEFRRFETAINAALSFGCPVICNNFELPLYRPSGNGEARFAGGNVRYIGRMNTLLAQLAAENNIYINDINYLSSYHGLANWHDETAWFAYKYPFAPRMIPFVCHSISAIVGAIFGKTKKSLILDLDNTLWGGVIGDDGVEGIEIGNESPIGMAHLELCKYALRLKEQGVMLAVCSKNEHDIALSGFERDEMPMKPDDFVNIKANWNPKSENIKELLGEINIGSDAAVFLDDNPAERHIVRGEIEDIVVPQLSQVDNFVSTVDKYNLFEVASLTADDLKRTEFLRANIERNRQQGEFANYGEYLKSLNMTAKIVSVGGGNLERVTQLVNKTNQFNMTTRRYTETEVDTLSKDSAYLTLCASLSDRFGDNGIVSVLFANVSGSECEIELFIMSCRVFKRELEFAMVDTLVGELIKRGVKTLKGVFIPTKKNKPCSDFYEKVGFSPTTSNEERSEYLLEIADYSQMSKNIVIENNI